jgi:hypothetical protein
MYFSLHIKELTISKPDPPDTDSPLDFSTE